MIDPIINQYSIQRKTKKLWNGSIIYYKNNNNNQLLINQIIEILYIENNSVNIFFKKLFYLKIFLIIQLKILNVMNVIMVNNLEIKIKYMLLEVIIFVVEAIKPSVSYLQINK